MMFLRPFALLTLFAALLVGCDSQPPELMSAVKSFATKEQTAVHVAEMRRNHMHLLMHKRDETMHQGIRTPKYSLHGCIDCHVPAPTQQRVVKHTDPEHFCVTCHLDVAVKVDCFQCHADRPTPTTTEGVKP